MQNNLARRKWSTRPFGRLVIIVGLAIGALVLDGVIVSLLWHGSGPERWLRRFLAARQLIGDVGVSTVVSLYIPVYVIACAVGAVLGNIRGKGRWAIDAWALGLCYMATPSISLVVCGPRGMTIPRGMLSLTLLGLQVLFVVASAWVAASLRGPLIEDEERCPHCGYLTKLLPLPRCPECGTNLSDSR